MKGDYSILKSVIREHYAALCAVAVRFVKSPAVAEDIVQEAIIKYWEQRERNQKISSTGNYLFTLVKHASLNYIRDEHRKAERHGKYAEEEEDSPHALNLLIEEESNQILREAIAELPEMEARVVRMGLSGLTEQEMAKLFQLTIPAIKSLRYDALRRLRKYLDAHV
ncbi:MAG: sigma-70 family RNA polymerase sigma factor [Odoribacteraceae bacterium]|jgi:RNA polymerase sigma-70 factor (ECF subfamily)|nr:sigma-70 family RNA polymerase sigma factor [Odoribacteraceae bacterium]